jgi:3-phosphoshikimate 1-carboxyvinyltransferase
MGARIATVEGHAPLTIVGDDLHGIEHRPSVPSAQVKSAVLLAGAQASGSTTVVESVGTRDHTERALTALGAPVRLSEGAVSVSAFQHQGFSGQLPGDPSSAAFLVAAAALSGSQVTLVGVGLNPTRLHFVDVMRRMGVRIHTHVDTDELGEPVGTIHVDPCDGIVPTRLAADEIPRVIDEIPVLASLAAFAPAETWFLGVGELRVKESDRLSAVVSGLRALGGEAAAEGEDLVIVGGGLDGGRVASGDDHRMAMSLTVAALGATGPSTIEGIEAADVSFPGFTAALRKLGADVEASR